MTAIKRWWHWFIRFWKGRRNYLTLIMIKLRLTLYLWWQVYKAEIKPFLKPTLAISFLIAWFITNGWAYLLVAIGSGWLRGLALTYIGLLWLPFTPEKIITIPLALFIQKKFFIRKQKIYNYDLYKKEKGGNL